MRKPLLFALLLFLACSLVAPAEAVLENSFCVSLANVTIPNDPIPSVVYTLENLCLTFENSTSFALSTRGFAQFNNMWFATETAICRGTYAFGSPQYIEFSYVISSPTTTFYRS